MTDTVLVPKVRFREVQQNVSVPLVEGTDTDFGCSVSGDKIGTPEEGMSSGLVFKGMVLRGLVIDGGHDRPLKNP